MRRRLRKQVTVVVILAAFFSGVGALIFLAVYEPPPPPPPPPPTFSPLIVRSADILRGERGQADLFAIVHNPNPNAGVRAVKYTLAIPVAGSNPITIPGETFFLPGQEKVIAHLNVAIPDGATSVSVTLGEPEWVPVGSDFRGPVLLTVSRESTIRDGAEPTYVLKGVLANESELDFLTVEVTALGLTADGRVIGVGRTFVGSLLALEPREYTVTWPLPVGIVVSEVRIFPEVNVFSPTAIQPRAGAPDVDARPRTTPAPREETPPPGLLGV